MGAAVATRVSAPGKLILMGEHAAVYGRPALVASISLRLSASFLSGGEGVQLSLPQIRLEERTDWAALLDYAARAREAWERFARDPGHGFAEVGAGDPAHLVKVALGEAAAICGGAELPATRIDLHSEIPIGSGFGSSAAAAVALTAGLLAHAGQAVAPDVVDRLALEVERRQHGLPSGVDHATVLRGGVHWAIRRDPAAPAELRPVEPRNPLLGRIRVFHTGPPAESTGDAVAAVRALRERDPATVAAALDRMEFATRRLRALVTDAREDVSAAIHVMREFQSCLDRLGVVPEPVRDAVRRIEEAGGAAKLSGAGSPAGPGAGCLLVLHPVADEIAGWRFLDPWISYDLQLGGPGLLGESEP